jgi:DNA-binding response OmpR family regulator/nitrogen-specific signal transduction histidine kinase
VKFRTKQIQDDKELIEEQAHQLLKMDELKTNFFNNISHEIRTPVTLIAAPMKNVLRQHSEEFSEEVKESLDLVHRNAQKLGGLVEELLEISKLDAGTQELYATPTLLFDYLEQLFLPYQAGAKLKKIDYQFDYPLDKKLCLQIDQKRLSKVINNLLSNAIKFTPNGGAIVLSVEEVEKEQTFICISVKDNGRGIPEKDLPYIFDRHFQSSKKTVPKEGGAGIGLALAKELTTLMKGEISVESTFGKGSLFKVLLPKEMADKEQKTSIDLEEVVVPIVVQKEVNYAKDNSLPKVLIVEDNPDMQLLIRSTLSEQYHCITANDGQEAWEWFDQKVAHVQDVQLIVSDIMMPRMDGHELLAKLKAHDEWSKLPIVMLTARSSKDAKLKALRLGVDDYLLKPFSSEELQVRVQNLLQNYQKRTVFKEEEKLQVDFEEVNSDDQNWLAEIEKAALDALEKSIELNAIYLSSTMMISERQLLRKLKSLTGLSIKKYIQEIKLQKARHLLESKAYQTVAEVAYASGFSTPSYLTKLYNSRFGKRPSAYLVKN